MVPQSVAEPVKKKAPPLKHAHCPGCFPAGGNVPTMCGAMKMAPPLRLRAAVVPAEACVVCAEMVFVPCERCGWHW